MSHKCPSCHSDQTASIVVAAGRDTRVGQIAGVELGEGLGIINAVSVETSAFGERLAPPPNQADQRSLFLPFVVLAIGGIGTTVSILMYQGATRSQRTTPTAFICAFGFLTLVGFIWWIVTDRQNAASWKLGAFYRAKARAKWAKLWVCYQCGDRFEPAAEALSTSASSRSASPTRSPRAPSSSSRSSRR